jgi:hypothetical protein
MAQRFDVCAPRPSKDGKTFWHRVGTAFQSDKGSIGLVFDSLPLPDKDGRVSVQLFEPKAKGDAPAKGQGSPARAPQVLDMDDEVPFAPEFR